MKRIASLESLRGLLALWVLVGHVIHYSGFEASDLGPFKIIAVPGLPVDDFIILSGFVIFYLLDYQRLSYRDFVLRRFFRLAPLFLLVLAVSAATQFWQIDVLQSLPWRTQSIDNALTIRYDTVEQYWAHLLVHVPMLHGLAPPAWLPSSDYAFVGQAWSISVEWQFYLIAPFLFLLVTQKRWYGLVAVLALVGMLRAINYGGDGFAINHAEYFLTGILCYLVFRRLATVTISDHRTIDLMAVAAMVFFYLLLSRSYSMMIWAAVFSMVIAEQHNSTTLPQRIMRRIFHDPVLQWLGKISYSVYMLHVLAISFWAQIVLAAQPDIDRFGFILLVLPLTLFSTIALSAVTYRFVERPGMDLGQRLSRRHTAPAAVSTVP